MVNNTKDLLTAVSVGLSPEETLLAGLQGMIAGTISMKRQMLGMTQSDLAKKLGVSQGLVSRWEQADSNFTLETLVRIASALDLQMQSPIVPKAPKLYSVGQSNLFIHPATSNWQHNVYTPAQDYIDTAKEN